MGWVCRGSCWQEEEKARRKDTGNWGGDPDSRKLVSEHEVVKKNGPCPVSKSVALQKEQLEEIQKLLVG